MNINDIDYTSEKGFKAGVHHLRYQISNTRLAGADASKV